MAQIAPPQICAKQTPPNRPPKFGGVFLYAKIIYKNNLQVNHAGIKFTAATLSCNIVQHFSRSSVQPAATLAHNLTRNPNLHRSQAGFNRHAIAQCEMQMQLATRLQVQLAINMQA